MRKIIKIMQSELRNMFYSPIAWLILVIFAIQSYMVFTGKLTGIVHGQVLGYTVNNSLSASIYSAMGSVYPSVLDYLYLYIPLLTMGLISKELNNGSIKLFYSSPVTSFQIITGKYLAIVVYGIILSVILLISIFISVGVIPSFDLPFALTGLLGVFLVICTYAAIGLFMSCLTSYQVVAAIGTLAILAVLNYIGNIGQENPFVREITYWLSINGRAGTFVSGLICSEDLLYFILVIFLFLGLSVFKLQSGKRHYPLPVAWGRYLGIITIIFTLGFITSRPSIKIFHDSTATKRLTLTPNSQEIIKQVKGGLTITAHTNLLNRHYYLGLQRSVKQNENRIFGQYTRFKPEIKFKYKYYYDKRGAAPYFLKQWKGLDEDSIARQRAYGIYENFKRYVSPQEMAKQVDLSGEEYRFNWQIERANGQKTFLRVFDDMYVIPFEAEISAALKRLSMPLPKVALLTGHGERDRLKAGERDYFTFANNIGFRQSLINNGFDVFTYSIEEDKPISPQEIDILVIADPRHPFSDKEMEKIETYIKEGGNLLIAAEPQRREITYPIAEFLGIRYIPGILVQNNADYDADLLFCTPTSRAITQSHVFQTMMKQNAKISVPTAMGLEHDNKHSFKTFPLIVSRDSSWNELQTTNFIDDTVKYNPETGEIRKAYVTAMALYRKVGEKEQRIVFMGDADAMSNKELSMWRNIRCMNYNLITETFRWLTRDEFPIDTYRPPHPDLKTTIDSDSVYWLKIIIIGIFPLILAIIGIIIWLRRKGR